MRKNIVIVLGIVSLVISICLGQAFISRHGEEGVVFADQTTCSYSPTPSPTPSPSSSVPATQYTMASASYTFPRAGRRHYFIAASSEEKIKIAGPSPLVFQPEIVEAALLSYIDQHPEICGLLNSSNFKKDYVENFHSQEDSSFYAAQFIQTSGGSPIIGRFNNFVVEKNSDGYFIIRHRSQVEPELSLNPPIKPPVPEDIEDMARQVLDQPTGTYQERDELRYIENQWIWVKIISFDTSAFDVIINLENYQVYVEPRGISIGFRETSLEQGWQMISDPGIFEQAELDENKFYIFLNSMLQNIIQEYGVAEGMNESFALINAARGARDLLVEDAVETILLVDNTLPVFSDGTMNDITHFRDGTPNWEALLEANTLFPLRSFVRIERPEDGGKHYISEGPLIVSSIIHGLEVQDISLMYQIEGVANQQGMFIRGDANVDNRVNIADAIYVLGYLFASGPEPACMDAADANDDGRVNISDAIKILTVLFKEGEFPAPAGPGMDQPGVDPTPDELTCPALAGGWISVDETAEITQADSGDMTYVNSVSVLAAGTYILRLEADTIGEQIIADEVQVIVEDGPPPLGCCEIVCRHDDSDGSDDIAGTEDDRPDVKKCMNLTHPQCYGCDGDKDSICSDALMNAGDGYHCVDTEFHENRRCDLDEDNNYRCEEIQDDGNTGMCYYNVICKAVPAPAVCAGGRCCNQEWDVIVTVNEEDSDDWCNCRPEDFEAVLKLKKEQLCLEDADRDVGKIVDTENVADFGPYCVDPQTSPVKMAISDNGAQNNCEISVNDSAECKILNCYEDPPPPPPEQGRYVELTDNLWPVQPTCYANTPMLACSSLAAPVLNESWDLRGKPSLHNEDIGAASAHDRTCNGPAFVNRVAIGHNDNTVVYRAGEGEDLKSLDYAPFKDSPLGEGSFYLSVPYGAKGDRFTVEQYYPKGQGLDLTGEVATGGIALQQDLYLTLESRTGSYEPTLRHGTLWLTCNGISERKLMFDNGGNLPTPPNEDEGNPPIVHDGDMAYLLTEISITKAVESPGGGAAFYETHILRYGEDYTTLEDILYEYLLEGFNNIPNLAPGEWHYDSILDYIATPSVSVTQMKKEEKEKDGKQYDAIVTEFKLDVDRAMKELPNGKVFVGNPKYGVVQFNITKVYHELAHKLGGPKISFKDRAALDQVIETKIYFKDYDHPEPYLELARPVFVMKENGLNHDASARTVEDLPEDVNQDIVYGQPTFSKGIFGTLTGGNGIDFSLNYDESSRWLMHVYKFIHDFRYGNDYMGAGGWDKVDKGIMHTAFYPFEATQPGLGELYLLRPAFGMGVRNQDQEPITDRSSYFIDAEGVTHFKHPIRTMWSNHGAVISMVGPDGQLMQFEAEIVPNCDDSLTYCAYTNITGTNNLAYKFLPAKNHELGEYEGYIVPSQEGGRNDSAYEFLAGAKPNPKIEVEMDEDKFVKLVLKSDLGPEYEFDDKALLKEIRYPEAEFEKVKFTWETQYTQAEMDLAGTKSDTSMRYQYPTQGNLDSNKGRMGVADPQGRTLNFEFNGLEFPAEFEHFQTVRFQVENGNAQTLKLSNVKFLGSQQDAKTVTYDIDEKSGRVKSITGLENYYFEYTDLGPSASADGRGTLSKFCDGPEEVPEGDLPRLCTEYTFVEHLDDIETDWHDDHYEDSANHKINKIGELVAVSFGYPADDGMPREYVFEYKEKETKMWDPLGHDVTYTFKGEETESESDPAKRDLSFFRKNTVEITEEFEPALTSTVEIEFEDFVRTKKVDNNGRETQFSYFDNHDLVNTITHPDGTTTGHTYNGKLRMLTLTEPVGRTTTFEYKKDPFHPDSPHNDVRLWKVTRDSDCPSAGGTEECATATITTEYHYSDNMLLEKITVDAAYIPDTIFTYYEDPDAHKGYAYLVDTVQKDGFLAIRTEEKNTYDAYGRVWRKQDGFMLSREVFDEYEYNPRDQVLEIAHPLSHWTIRAYEPTSGLLLGEATTPPYTFKMYKYNNNRFLWEVEQTDGEKTRTEYNANDQVTKTWPEQGFGQTYYFQYHPGGSLSKTCLDANCSTGQVVEANHYHLTGEIWKKIAYAGENIGVGEWTQSYYYTNTGQLHFQIMGSCANRESNCLAGPVYEYVYYTDGKSYGLLKEENASVRNQLWPYATIKEYEYTDARKVSKIRHYVKELSDVNLEERFVYSKGGLLIYKYDPYTSEADLDAGIVNVAGTEIGQTSISYSYNGFGDLEQTLVNGVQMERNIYDAFGFVERVRERIPSLSDAGMTETSVVIERDDLGRVIREGDRFDKITKYDYNETSANLVSVVETYPEGSSDPRVTETVLERGGRKKAERVNNELTVLTYHPNSSLIYKVERKPDPIPAETGETTEAQRTEEFIYFPEGNLSVHKLPEIASADIASVRPTIHYGYDLLTNLRTYEARSESEFKIFEYQDSYYPVVTHETAGNSQVVYNYDMQGFLANTLLKDLSAPEGEDETAQAQVMKNFTRDLQGRLLSATSTYRDSELNQLMLVRDTLKHDQAGNIAFYEKYYERSGRTNYRNTITSLNGYDNFGRKRRTMTWRTDILQDSNLRTPEIHSIEYDYFGGTEALKRRAYRHLAGTLDSPLANPVLAQSMGFPAIEENYDLIEERTADSEGRLQSFQVTVNNKKTDGSAILVTPVKLEFEYDEARFPQRIGRRFLSHIDTEAPKTHYEEFDYWPQAQGGKMWERYRVDFNNFPDEETTDPTTIPGNVQYYERFEYDDYNRLTVYDAYYWPMIFPDDLTMNRTDYRTHITHNYSGNLSQMTSTRIQENYDLRGTHYFKVGNQSFDYGGIMGQLSRETMDFNDTECPLDDPYGFLCTQKNGWTNYEYSYFDGYMRRKSSNTIYKRDETLAALIGAPLGQVYFQEQVNLDYLADESGNLYFNKHREDPGYFHTVIKDHDLFMDDGISFVRFNREGTGDSDGYPFYYYKFSVGDLYEATFSDLLRFPQIDKPRNDDLLNNPITDPDARLSFKEKMFARDDLGQVVGIFKPQDADSNEKNLLKYMFEYNARGQSQLAYWKNYGEDANVAGIWFRYDEHVPIGFKLDESTGQWESQNVLSVFGHTVGCLNDFYKGLVGIGEFIGNQAGLSNQGGIEGSRRASFETGNIFSYGTNYVINRGLSGMWSDIQYRWEHAEPGGQLGMAIDAYFFAKGAARTASNASLLTRVYGGRALRSIAGRGWLGETARFVSRKGWGGFADLRVARKTRAVRQRAALRLARQGAAQAVYDATEMRIAQLLIQQKLIKGDDVARVLSRPSQDLRKVNSRRVLDRELDRLRKARYNPDDFLVDDDEDITRLYQHGPKKEGIDPGYWKINGTRDAVLPEDIVQVQGKSVGLAGDLTLAGELRQAFPGRFLPGGKGIMKEDNLYKTVARDIRKAGYELIRAPVPGNPGHVLIIPGARTFDDPVGRALLSTVFKLLERAEIP